MGPSFLHSLGRDLPDADASWKFNRRLALSANTGCSLRLNSFRFAVICVQFDERGGKCSIRNLRPTQDISDA
jgi:hypothetical protein